ncbi:unnamed protein product [Rodentolepis nana]|uniref:Endo/exonuclease/phosphatase domain-containing protein n=1 Tax=Rodentolepis nana TaxID=102285 RepID=A0A0R3TER1_RODNA|nr:unnamed protein product [Rodentolepis nana]
MTSSNSRLFLLLLNYSSSYLLPYHFHLVTLHYSIFPSHQTWTEASMSVLKEIPPDSLTIRRYFSTNRQAPQQLDIFATKVTLLQHHLQNPNMQKQFSIPQVPPNLPYDGIKFWRDNRTWSPLVSMGFNDIITIMEANISDEKLKYQQFPGYTLYLLTKYRQVARGNLTGVKEGLTSHYDLIKIYNPPQNCPNFDFLNISHNTIVLGDFNAHSTGWGYKDTKIAGKEIEDMLNSNPLKLICSNEDPATYFNLFTAMRIRLHIYKLICSNEDPATYLHNNGTRTTPDLLLASSDISEHTRRKIIDNPGFGHKPVIASITTGSKSMKRKVPTKLSWNFKKAEWPRFTNLLGNELHTSPLNFNQHPDKLCNDITNIMIRCDKKTNPPKQD